MLHLFLTSFLPLQWEAVDRKLFWPHPLNPLRTAYAQTPLSGPQNPIIHSFPQLLVAFHSAALFDSSEASRQNTSLCAAHLWEGTPCGTVEVALTRAHRGTTGTGVLDAFAATWLRWLRFRIGPAFGNDIIDILDMWISNTDEC